MLKRLGRDKHGIKDEYSRENEKCEAWKCYDQEGEK